VPPLLAAQTGSRDNYSRPFELSDLLDNDDMFRDFTQFLMKEFSVENALFLEAIQKYRTLGKNPLTSCTRLQM
jgi:hypothetical protein